MIARKLISFFSALFCITVLTVGITFVLALIWDIVKKAIYQ